MAAAHNRASGFTLYDLLTCQLSVDATTALWRELSSAQRSELANARRACSALRAFVDAHTTELRISLEGVESAGRGSLCDPETHWLHRWPRCAKLTLDAGGVSSPGTLAVPVVGASPEASGRIRELTIIYDQADRFQSIALFGLLRSLPGLEALAIWGQVAQEDLDYGEEVLLSSALSSPPNLASLHLPDMAWVRCIRPSLASRLTKLKIEAADRDDGDEGDEVMAERMAAVIPIITQLQELDVDEQAKFKTYSMRQVLDGLAPSVRHVTIGRALLAVDAQHTAGMRFTLAGGTLQRLTIVIDAGHWILYEKGRPRGSPEAWEIASFLAEVLLPSRALGPRLPRLDLDLALAAGVWDDGEGGFQIEHKALQLLARCDSVRWKAADATDSAAEGLAAAIRLYGMPEEVVGWAGSMSTRVRVHLWGSPSGAGNSIAEGGGAGGGGAGSSGAGSSGAGGGGSGGGGSVPPPLPLASLLERALGRVVSAGSGAAEGGVGAAPAKCPPALSLRDAIASEGSNGRCGVGFRGGNAEAQTQTHEDHPHDLLLRGPALSAAAPADMRACVDELCRRVQLKGPHRAPWGRSKPCILFYQPLPPAGAVLVRCSSAAAGEAVRVEARRGWPPAGGDGVGGSGIPLAECEALPTKQRLSQALSQVLQAAWDGEEPGGPSADVAELERLTWLTESLKGLRELPKPVHTTWEYSMSTGF